MNVTSAFSVGAVARPHAFPPGRTSFGITVPGLAFVPASTDLWRVVATNGVVRGHIERRPTQHGDRYAARLLPTGGSRPQPLGEFWSPVEAAQCFA